MLLIKSKAISNEAQARSIGKSTIKTRGDPQHLGIYLGREYILTKVVAVDHL